MAEEILHLSTIVDRNTITIDSKQHPNGKTYELTGLADLGPYEYAIIFQRNEELERIGALKKPTEAQERQVRKMLDDSVALVVRGIEPAVVKSLTAEQKQMVLLAWSSQLERGAAEGKAPSRRTTGASSRASRRSTAATRKRGSTPPRGR